MRKSGISLLLMLFAVAGWAQESKTEKKDSIPPRIVEGTLERVPDGTVVMVGGRMGGSCSYGPNQGDTLRNGKFRIIYTPESPTDEYMMTAMYNGAHLRHYFMFYASPGTKATIKGEGIHPANWYAKSDNPKQIEANEYRAYLDEKLPGYWDLQRRNDWVNEEDDDYYSVKKKVREADSLYVEYMIEFMKSDRILNDYYDSLVNIATIIQEMQDDESWMNTDMSVLENAIREMIEPARRLINDYHTGRRLCLERQRLLGGDAKEGIEVDIEVVHREEREHPQG